MRKTKTQKGITLVALVITIIVLLILAAVAIGAIQNKGIIKYAQNASADYEAAEKQEQSVLASLLDKIKDNVPGNSGEGNEENEGSGNENEGSEGTGGNQGDNSGTGNGNSSDTTTTVLEAQGKVLSTTSNTVVADEYGNTIVVPAGFKITTDASKVTEGIVIEDCTELATAGSQFVWVPVGTIYTNTEKTEYKTITLGRYSEFTANDEGEYVPAQTAANYATATVIYTYFTEDTSANHNTEYGNTIAKDIGAFVTSTITKGGYYIGRYEAGVINYDTTKTVRSNSSSETNWTGYVAEEGKELQLVSKKDVQVWNYVTQNKASSLSRSMYTSSNFTSDLINSYAWDTAIIFIQTFGGCADYAERNFSTSFANTGINNDKYCNIYDMSGNAFEWSTETSSHAGFPCVYRGGYSGTVYGLARGYTSGRSRSITTNSSSYHSFRPLLYVAL